MEKKKYPITTDEIIEEDMQKNTVSYNDLTGLTPSAVLNDYEEESYEKLYPYIASEE